MKGYNVNFQQFVGCSHCLNTWYETSTHNLGPTAINGPRYKYNACDRCYDADKGQYRSQHNLGSLLKTITCTNTSTCLWDNVPDGTVAGIACPCPKHSIKAQV